VAKRDFFGLNDLEALHMVTREAKEWIAAQALKRLSASLGSLGPPGAFLYVERVSSRE
jgi:hypothetical protein